MKKQIVTRGGQDPNGLAEVEPMDTDVEAYGTELPESRPRSVSARPIIKPYPSEESCSTLNNDIKPVISLFVGLLAAGESISEERVLEILQNDFKKLRRYSRRYCRSVLKMIHDTHPNETTLQLVDGVWVLVPICGGENA